MQRAVDVAVTFNPEIRGKIKNRAIELQANDMAQSGKKISKIFITTPPLLIRHHPSSKATAARPSLKDSANENLGSTTNLPVLSINPYRLA